MRRRTAGRRPRCRVRPCSRASPAQASRIARIEIKQGDKAMTLARDKDALVAGRPGRLSGQARGGARPARQARGGGAGREQDAQQGSLCAAGAGGPRCQGRQVAPRLRLLDDKGGVDGRGHHRQEALRCVRRQQERHLRAQARRRADLAQQCRPRRFRRGARLGAAGRARHRPPPRSPR